MNKERSQWQKFVVLAISTCCLILSVRIALVRSQTPSTSNLPTAKIHSLPAFLTTWQDVTKSGNYFQQIEPTPLGYLVWSEFPVTVYVQQPAAVSGESTAADKRFEQWTATVQKAIAEWQVYFPLQQTSDRETADIVIWRSQPKREVQLNPDTGLYDIPRAVTAETTYKFYLKQNPKTIAHKMTVQISPSYTGIALLATVRHELGHALGIWGHSLVKTDALYFSQVSDPSAISPRDINTLKEIYQHSTRLGWEINH